MGKATVAFIGLGAMGLPMARNLAGAGYKLIGYDADSAVLARAREAVGLRVSAEGAEAAGAADVLFSCLPNDAVLREVYLGPKGLWAALKPGTITIDCSTVSPAVTREIHDALAPREVRHLDASMLGSTPQAEAGEIGFVVGGEEEAFVAARPLLEVLGGYTRYAGPSGAANQIKLIHQTLVAINAAAVAEAAALCLASGTDLDTFYDVVCNAGGMAYSRYFERRLPRMRGGDYSPLFMARLMAKDAGLAQDLARDRGMESPVLDSALGVFAKVLEGGLGGEDFSAVMKVYEEAIGRRLEEAG